MSAESEAQFASLNRPEWLDHLRAKGTQIFTALSGLEVQTDELRFVIDAVPVAVAWTPREVDVRAGRNDDGSPMYRWVAPLAWLVVPVDDGEGG